MAWVAPTLLWVSRENWLWITPIALSINALLMTYDWLLSFAPVDSRPLEGQDAWGLLKDLHQASEGLALRPPKVMLVQSSSAQIFAYGRSSRSVRLFVSEGFLKLLSPAERQAVLLYQLLAIQRNYPVLNYWLAVTVDLIYRLGLQVERVFAFVFGWNAKIAHFLAAPFMLLAQHLLLSPADFARLDHDTKNMIGNPDDLARALWKLSSYARTQPWTDPWALAHMCIVSPIDWWPIQPQLNTRIMALVGRYPL
jgi:hypothetical protein